MKQEHLETDYFGQNEETDAHCEFCLWRGLRKGLAFRNGSELLCLWASLLLCRSPPEGCMGALLDVGIAGAPKHLCDCTCSVCQGTALLQEFTAFLMYSEKKQLCGSSHSENKTKARTKCCSQELLTAVPAGCLHLAQTGCLSPPPSASSLSAQPLSLKSSSQMQGKKRPASSPVLVPPQLAESLKLICQQICLWMETRTWKINNASSLPPWREGWTWDSHWNPQSQCVSSIQQRYGAPGHQITYKHGQLSLRSFPCPRGNAADFLSWPIFLLIQLPRAKRTFWKNYKYSSHMLEFQYQNKVPPFSLTKPALNQIGWEAEQHQGAGGQHNFFIACTLRSHKNLQISSHTSPLCLWKGTWAPEIWPCVRLAWLLSAERKQRP